MVYKCTIFKIYISTWMVMDIFYFDIHTLYSISKKMHFVPDLIQYFESYLANFA